ncbi:MAG: ferritin-like domain-containing protein [Candidatus Geothermincolia bacterium]
MNEAIARELQVSIQYMWQHVMSFGINSESVGGVFRGIGITEMKHAEEIAERLDYLGGVPTTQPRPIEVGGDLEKMLSDDMMAEEGAIELYKEIIEVAAEEKDFSTKKIFMDILETEEEHHNTFRTLLQK